MLYLSCIEWAILNGLHWMGYIDSNEEFMYSSKDLLPGPLNLELVQNKFSGPNATLNHKKDQQDFIKWKQVWTERELKLTFGEAFRSALLRSTELYYIVRKQKIIEFLSIIYSWHLRYHYLHFMQMKKERLILFPKN